MLSLTASLGASQLLGSCLHVLVLLFLHSALVLGAVWALRVQADRWATWWTCPTVWLVAWLLVSVVCLDTLGCFGVSFEGGHAVSLRDFRSGFVHHLAAPETVWLETFLYGLRLGIVTWTLSFLLLVSASRVVVFRTLKSKSHRQVCKRHRHCSPSTVKLQLVMNVIINYLLLLLPLPPPFCLSK